MKTRIVKRLIAMVGVACLGVTLMFTPAATKTVSAAQPGVSEPDQNIVEWVYMVDPMEKKLYKRLYNHSTGNWVGNWIFVRNLTDQEVEIWFRNHGVG